MTASEIVNRVAGVIPTTFTVRLLVSVQLPYDNTIPLNELSYPGYGPIFINSAKGGVMIAPQLSKLDQWVDVFLPDGAKEQTCGGVAVYCTSTEGDEILVSYSPNDNPLVLSEGHNNCLVSIMAHGNYVGEV